MGNAAAAFLCRNSSRVGAKGKLLETERGTTHLPWSWKGWGGKYPSAERPAAIVTDESRQQGKRNVNRSTSDLKSGSVRDAFA